MRLLKNVYHALIPPPVRYPIGRWRRRTSDRWLRWTTAGPLPPGHLLVRVQETPYVREYVTVGKRSARAVRSALKEVLPGPRKPQVLDFGCGLGRTLRFLETAGWDLFGCDVDVETLGWSACSLPFARFEVSSTEPPLPYPDAFFDALYAVSVFTHFDAEEQASWAAELARVLVPGGHALISTMGPRAFGHFVRLANDRDSFLRNGFFFHAGKSGNETPEERGFLPPRPAFSRRGAFHTRGGLERFFGEDFELESWIDGGLDGFQDLARMRRRSTAGAG